MSEITLKDIAALIDSGKLSERDLSVLEAQLTKLEKLKNRELIQKRFMKFVEAVWPSFIGGRHHDRMAAAFERVARGECKRLIINMPPRHTKSEFASYLLPACSPTQKRLVGGIHPRAVTTLLLVWAVR